MDHPLDGAKLKVVRAREHLEAFKRELEEYHNSNPYQAMVTIVSGTAHAVPAASPPPPPRLSCAIGDCVVNLNAALDYIAWQLALKFWRPAPVAGRSKIFFFRPHTLASNSSMDAAALDLVKSIQPGKPGYEDLASLNSLVNEDKHRLPLLTLATCRISDLRIAAGSLQVHTSNTAHASRMSLSLAPVREGEPPLLVKDVEVESQGAVFVTFKNPDMPRATVDRTLENIVGCVGDIVPRFDQFFP